MPEFISRPLRSAQDHLAAVRTSADGAVKQARTAAVNAGHDIVARVSAKLPEGVKVRLNELQAEAAKQAGKLREQGTAVRAQAKSALDELRTKTLERVEQAESAIGDLRARALRRVGLAKEEAAAAAAAAAPAAPAAPAAQAAPANAPEQKSAAQG